MRAFIFLILLTIVTPSIHAQSIRERLDDIEDQLQQDRIERLIEKIDKEMEKNYEASRRETFDSQNRALQNNYVIPPASFTPKHNFDSANEDYFKYLLALIILLLTGIIIFLLNERKQKNIQKYQQPNITEKKDIFWGAFVAVGGLALILLALKIANNLGD